MHELWESVGITGLIDIVVMTIIIYSILVWFKRTHAAFVALGLFMVGAAYLIARQLGLMLTTTMFQGFFAIILIAVVIIFQEEIKRFLEQLASRSVLRRRYRRRILSDWQKNVDIIVDAVHSLANDHIGALIVIRGKDPVVRHLNGGEDLDGELSQQLLETLFIPGSPSHDGAVIIEENKITKFSCYLPLSKNLRKLQKAGTRHAAALGMAEVTDAFCIVVSEEKGTISVARNNDITVMRDAEELRSRLEAFYQEVTPSANVKPLNNLFRQNYREMIIALVSTLILWFFFVHESKIDYRTYILPVVLENVPSTLVVKSIEPQEVEVTFSGPRRQFLVLNEKSLKITVTIFNGREGTYRRTITRSNIAFPEGLSVEYIHPQQIIIQLNKKE
ncbi:MAG TPA: diadenylate cyclase CdaA [Bacteroidota bacterium]|mgnify:CR=1 FL=1|nr:diadenylate cyclase CdaA [Bacteroidota bacterium]